MRPIYHASSTYTAIMRPIDCDLHFATYRHLCMPNIPCESRPMPCVNYPATFTMRLLACYLCSATCSMLLLSRHFYNATCAMRHSLYTCKFKHLPFDIDHATFTRRIQLCDIYCATFAMQLILRDFSRATSSWRQVPFDTDHAAFTCDFFDAALRYDFYHRT